MAPRKCLLFVSSATNRLNDLRVALKDQYACVQLTLDKFTHGSVIAVDGIVIDIDLKNANAVEMVRKGLLHVDRKQTFLIMVVDPKRHGDPILARKLKANEVIHGPSFETLGKIQAEQSATSVEIQDQEFLRNGVQMIERLVNSFAMRVIQPKMMREAIHSGDNAMSQIFDMARLGHAPERERLQQDSKVIIDALYEHGLDAWLNLVRTHHDATYQHCLIVTGVATAFGQSIGCNTKDIERISIGAMLHDIGKSKIPLEILSKAGPLSAEEWVVMRTHPVIGREIVLDFENFDPEVLDIIAHHHEYLDGSGYPDKLSGSEISDIVRVMTISDIFGAMMERRSYKAEMSPTQAYEVLLSMHTKLEKPLVRAFGKILETFSSAA